MSGISGFDLYNTLFVTDKNTSHSQMGINFANKLSEALISYNPSLPKATADPMAAAGIFKLNPSQVVLNLNERDVRNNNQSGKKCN